MHPPVTAAGSGSRAPLCVKPCPVAIVVDLENVAVEDVCEASFEGSAGFGGGLSFVDLAEVVDAAGSRIAALANGDGVQRGVQLPVAAGVEAVAVVVAAGGFDR